MNNKLMVRNSTCTIVPISDLCAASTQDMRDNLRCIVCMEYSAELFGTDHCRFIYCAQCVKRITEMKIPCMCACGERRRNFSINVYARFMVNNLQFKCDTCPYTASYVEQNRHVCPNVPVIPPIHVKEVLVSSSKSRRHEHRQEPENQERGVGFADAVWVALIIACMIFMGALESYKRYYYPCNPKNTWDVYCNGLCIPYGQHGATDMNNDSICGKTDAFLRALPTNHSLVIRFYKDHPEQMEMMDRFANETRTDTDTTSTIDVAQTIRKWYTNDNVPRLLNNNTYDPFDVINARVSDFLTFRKMNGDSVETKKLFDYTTRVLMQNEQTEKRQLFAHLESIRY